MPVSSQTRIAGKPRSVSMLDPFYASVAFFIPFLSSLHLLGNDLLGARYAEWTMGISRLGIVQFPGFPLYILAAKCITWLTPFGSEIWRINFASLFFASTASLLVFLTGRRLSFAPLISLAAALLFFFSPFMWRTALVADHYAFDALLITACIYVTLGFLNQPSSRHLRFRLTSWAVLCGLTGTQHPALTAWSITALIMGLVMGLPRTRIRTQVFWPILIGVLAGAMLPYVYFPLRLLSPKALFNPDLIAFTLVTPPSQSFKAMVFWLAGYFVEGTQNFFTVLSFRSALAQLWSTLAQFASDYPFFPLVLIGWGLLLNWRAALIRQPGAAVSGFDSASRLTLSLLPFCALGGEVLLLREHTQWTQLNLSLGCAYWSLAALEYCHQILGHSDESLSAKSQSRLKPTWFGILVVAVVPLLAFIHSYGSLRRHIPRADRPDSTLNETIRLMQELPEKSVLFFPKARWQYPFDYVQSSMKLRPDITLHPFSQTWPTIQKTQDHFFHFLGQSPQQQFLEKMDYSREWVRQLSRKTRPGSQNFLVTRPVKPDAILQFLLQSLQVSESHAPIAYWTAPGSKKYLSVFHIERLSEEIPSAESQPPSRDFISDFGQTVRLIFGQMQKPVVREHQLAVLKITLTWQILRTLPENRFRVLFQIVPAANENTPVRPGSHHVLWKETRLLGAKHQHTFHTRAIWHESYQLMVPQSLPVGRYAVMVALQEKKSNQLLPAGEVLDQPVYFISACEFWVVDSESKGESEAKP